MGEAISGYSTDEATQEVMKFNAYVDLINYMNGWFEPNLESYIETFGLDGEFDFEGIGIDSTELKGWSITPIMESKFTRVDEAVAYANGKPSFDAADDSMKELAPKLKQLMDTINDIQFYYSSKGYVDDQFALANEMHTKFVHQYSDYSHAADSFYLSFKPITQKMDLDVLEQFKDEGYMLHYYARSILMNVKGINQAFNDSRVDDSNILEFDPMQYNEMYKELAENINQFNQYATDAEQIEKEGIESVYKFNESAKELKGAATTILEVLESQNAELDPVSVGGTAISRGFGYLEYFNRIASSLTTYYNIMTTKSG